MTARTIALVGATGHLGGLIAAELLAIPEVTLRILVRPDSRPKATELEARGAQVVEGDLDDLAALAELASGAFAVISAVQGGPEVIIDGQLALLRAARDAGVRRFIPSDYSLDMFQVPEGAIATADLRRHFADAAEAERGEVEVTHVLIGGFLDRGVLFGFIRIVDPATKTAYVWGEGQAPMDFTTYADAAAYTAAVALDDEPVGRTFKAAGDVQNFDGVVAAYQEGSSSTLAIETLGSLEDLDARIQQLQAAGDFYGFLPLQYYRANLKGQGRLEPLMNDRYPQITPTTIREYVAAEHL